MWANKNKKDLFIPRLVAVNIFVVLLVILLNGFLLKEYSCYLVTTKKVTGKQFSDTLNLFLLEMSILSLLGAVIFHYFSVKKILKPVRLFSAAALSIKNGHLPSPIIWSGRGELGELAENFNSMVQTLSFVKEQRDEMLKDIAHELRTPLTNINGYLEALQNGVIKGDEEIYSSLLEESKRITRIAELITELNDWEKQIDFLDKPFENWNSKNILSETLTAFQLKIEANFTNVDIELESVYLYCNKDGLKQVFTNILQNMVDYNNGNWLNIKSELKGKYLTISFSHSGKWIDPNKKEKIFKRFYRLDESRTSKGAGLGLSISKSIIQAHNGLIGLETNGVDHTFWLRLPRAYKLE